MNRTLHGLVGMALVSLAVGGPAVAQDSGSRVAANTDWSVFVDGDPKTCWAVSAPKQTVNTKNGKPAQVKRGDILLFITYSAGKTAEISFSGGYPFAPGSSVDLDVGGTKFALFTDGETAWAASADDDAKIVGAMKAGSSAVFTAHSAKGTQTEDTFSLTGFSASVDEAAKQCAG